MLTRRIRAGLAPEFVRFSDVMYVGAEHNLLRPETVEALFVLWRTTGDARYRDWGWEIFEAFETHCRVCASHPLMITRIQQRGAAV